MSHVQREQEEQKREEARKTIPHFWNLNEDPQLTSMIIHFCPPGKSRIGNNKANPPAQIQLNGLRYYHLHIRILCVTIIVLVAIASSRNMLLLIIRVVQLLCCDHVLVLEY